MKKSSIIPDTDINSVNAKLKQAEEALRKNKECFSKAEKIAHLGYWEWDIATNELIWSEEVFRLYGLDPEKVVPTYETVISTLSTETKDWFNKAVNDAVNNNAPFEGEYSIIRPDGSVRYTHTIGEVFRDKNGKPVSMFGVVQDITEHKHAEENLLLFHNLMDQSNDAIFVNDPGNGRILDANNRACISLGYTRKELFNMNVFDFEVSLPEKFSWDDHVKQVQSKGHLLLEGLHRRKDGTTFPVEVNVSFIVLGTKNYMFADVRDITERKTTEKLLLENLRLEAADKAKSEFLSAMSHELRTPLNAVIGFSELLKMNTMGTLNEKQESYVDNIRYGGKHLLNIITDILDLSKIEAGKMELTIDKTSLSEVIDETINLMNEVASKKKVTFIKELDPQIVFIEADKQKLKQIFFNLLSNAVKFSKNGGGTVTISTNKEGDMARISVSDKGIGIKEEDIKRLFREFEQLDSGTGRKYGGTGLGLAISKKLVELHGGKIRVESEFGKWTSFIFSLPIIAREKNIYFNSPGASRNAKLP